jgi:hypothetical protein
MGRVSELFQELKIQEGKLDLLEVEFQGLNKGRLYRERLKLIKAKIDYLKKKARKIGIGGDITFVYGTRMTDSGYKTFKVYYQNIEQDDIPLLLNRDIRGWEDYNSEVIKQGVDQYIG